MNAPGQSTTLISDLIPKVKAALQNRSDVTEDAAQQPNPEMRPSAWIRDALREITESQPFEELRTTGPRVPLIPGQYAYSVSYFLNSGDDVTLMEDPVIFLDSPASQQVSYPMDYLTPKAIAPLLNIQGGVPFKYTRYGKQFWFGTNPGQAYIVYLPYQIRHPFDDANLKGSTVFVPPSWLDIVAYAAAERGAVNLRWSEQSTFLHTLLYGDPASMNKDGTLNRPGLIAARVFQIERDRRLSTVQLTAFAQRY